MRPTLFYLMQNKTKQNKAKRNKTISLCVCVYVYVLFFCVQSNHKMKSNKNQSVC